jgi:hypothetical protein
MRGEYSRQYPHRATVGRAQGQRLPRAIAGCPEPAKQSAAERAGGRSALRDIAAMALTPLARPVVAGLVALLVYLIRARLGHGGWDRRATPTSTGSPTRSCTGNCTCGWNSP